ncbi:5-bromo-4-chloroindolyl phosphate hydrolysis family protein [Baileyella intestinalis]|uniref:5-bromo-4-chloroindolyl phosphate hydrolysis family protein n=1 Tax=Baileyella intestinalis TaxID=2606709 RepID=UPI0022E8C205|nr:5-bromo-4-chloroindolyl phosphate hydrolysis family protein [Baileyella intestinalis]
MVEDKNTKNFPEREEAVETGKPAADQWQPMAARDFDSLSDSIQQEVDTFTRSLNQQVGAINMNLRVKNEIVPGDQAGHDRTQRQDSSTTRQNSRTTRKVSSSTHPSHGSRNTAPFLLHKPSKTFHKGRLWVSGIVGASMLSEIGDEPDDAIFGMAIFAFCLFVFISTIRNNGLIKRFYLYSQVIGNRDSITISKLAAALGTSSDKVKKDLNKFKNKGWLPQGIIDESGRNLFLTDEAVIAYQDAIARKNDLDARTDKAMTDLNTDDISPEVKAIIVEGEKFVKDIRQANDEIPDEYMSDKLYDLEDIVARIFDYVKKHPESAGELSRFMSYYVPTTRKLMNAYVELNKQPDAGSNITSTKKQIEDGMDTIIQACQSLLDTMFQDVAEDIAADISVLKTMAARDGLTRDEGEPENKTGPLKF